MKNDYDVLIVGASVAGSSLALKLGLAGAKVGLFEKTEFPRRKACGEGLSLVGFKCLADLGMSEQISASLHKPYGGYKIWTGKGPIPFTSIPEIVKGYGIQRYVLDDLIRSKAVETGNIDSHVNCPVKKIQTCNDYYEIETASGSVKARFIVLACGLNSRLLGDIGATVKVPAKKRFGFSMILDGSSANPPAEINVMLRKGFEIYITPTGGSRINVNILGERSAITAVSKKEDRELFLAKIKDIIGYTGETVEAALGAGPVGTRTDSSYYGNALLIGDCRESLDPIGGLGMTHALVSSALAGDALINILKNGATPEFEFPKFEKRRASQVRPLRGFTNIIYFSLKKLGPLPVFPILSRLPLPALLGEALISGGTDRSFRNKCFRFLLHLAGSWKVN